jgi:hypothetical protein
MILETPTLAAGSSVGVQVGDWMEYGDVSASWVGAGTEPNYITEIKRIDWMKAEVQSVSGTNVSVKATTHYKNGTDKTEMFVSDVANVGVPGGEVPMSILIIPAGLGKGDTFSMLSGIRVNVVLNDTVSRVYVGESRSVNLCNLTSSDAVWTTFRSSIYWDQLTGVLLEMSAYASSSSETVQYSFKASETNIWSLETRSESTSILGVILNNLIYIVIIVAAVVVLAVGTFFIRRKKKVPKALSTS